MNAGRVTIVGGCLYEVYALVTGRVPPITAIVQTIGRRRYARVVMWLWVGFWVDHFAHEATS